MSIRIINNVPADQVDEQERIARDTGATSVQRIVERDGEYTLVIVYPDYEQFSDLDARLRAPLPNAGSD